MLFSNIYATVKSNNYVLYVVCTLYSMQLKRKLLHTIPFCNYKALRGRGCRASMSPANCPPEPPDLQNSLLANQNRLRASFYVWQAAQLCLTSNNSISINKYLAFTSTKRLFFKKSQHVYESLLLLRLRVKSSFFVFLNFTNFFPSVKNYYRIKHKITNVKWRISQKMIT